MILQDVYRYDQETLEKISRNITPEFKEWMHSKQKKKENVSINIKGDTRAGKSITGLAVSDELNDFYEDKEFDTEQIVCGNQKEYRLKLKDCEFGDVYQIDENAFANVGVGSHTEMTQLKDIQNIIAKMNIHTIYITPRMFLETNATLGLSTWGKDSKNWLSRLLVYDLRTKSIPLLGYIIIDVGKIFRKYGCFLYKELGGCTNPNKLKFEDLKKDTLKHTSCIPKKYDKKELLSDGKSCPFYNLCKHQMCKYEHKKDTWIKKEMEGGMDERVKDRYETALKLFYLFAEYDTSQGKVFITARDGKQLKIKINMMMGTVSSTKFTITEIDEIVVMIRSLADINFFNQTCKSLKLDESEEFAKIPLK